jgi:hypothetical protein
MRPRIISMLTAALLLAACNKYDIQPEQAEGFIKFFSSTLTEEAYDVKPTADEGYVAIGTTRDEEGMRDLYLVKTDRYGNEESWSPAIIGGPFDDAGTSIQVEPDGYVILGYSNERDTTQYDMYLVKTNLQGSVVWKTWTDDPGDERGTSLQITSAGEYLAAGLRRNSISGNYDYKIVRFDAVGNIVKDRIINIDPAGTVLDAFIIETQTYFMICGTEQFNGKNEIHIIPIDKDSHFANGGKSFTASDDLTGNCIQELSDGNLLICGTIQNLQRGLNEIYLNKISPSLGAISGWEAPKTFTGSAVNASLTGNAVRIIGGDSYAIIGTRTETGNEDIILLHSDGSGKELSRRIFGDEGFQQGVSLEVTGSDGGLILVGNNGSEDNSMMALVKTNADGE